MASDLVVLWGKEEINDIRVSPWGAPREGQKDLRQLQREYKKNQKRHQDWPVVGMVQVRGETEAYFPAREVDCLMGFKSACFLWLHPGDGLSFKWSQVEPEQCWGLHPNIDLVCLLHRSPLPFTLSAAARFCYCLAWRNSLLILHLAFLQMAMRSFWGHLAYTAFRAA